MYVCAPHVCKYPWRPEEGIISSGAEVTGSWELTDVGATN